MADEINIEELVQDDHNFNKGTTKGRAMLDKSFSELGAGRSILVDKDNRIIAGNKSQSAAEKNGIKKVIVVETDGTELIAVKRKDIELNSEKGRKLALADNATATANLSWDGGELQYVMSDMRFEFNPQSFDLDFSRYIIDKKEQVEKEQQLTKEVCPKCGHIWCEE